MNDLETKEETQTIQGGGTKKPRHYVRILEGGEGEVEHEQKTLCGELWDRINVQHNGEICQKCVEISRRL